MCERQHINCKCIAGRHQPAKFLNCLASSFSLSCEKLNDNFHFFLQSGNDK